MYIIRYIDFRPFGKTFNWIQIKFPCSILTNLNFNSLLFYTVMSRRDIQEFVKIKASGFKPGNFFDRILYVQCLNHRKHNLGVFHASCLIIHFRFSFVSLFSVEVLFFLISVKYYRLLHLSNIKSKIARQNTITSNDK